MNHDASLSLLDVCGKLLDELHDANDQQQTADTCCLPAVDLFAWPNMRICCCNIYCRDHTTGILLIAAHHPAFVRSLIKSFSNSAMPAKTVITILPPGEMIYVHGPDKDCNYDQRPTVVRLRLWKCWMPILKIGYAPELCVT